MDALIVYRSENWLGRRNFRCAITIWSLRNENPKWTMLFGLKIYGQGSFTRGKWIGAIFLYYDVTHRFLVLFCDFNKFVYRE